MAWIESHTVLIRHRKLLQLAIALSLRPVEVLGHLTALWHSVLEQQEDGVLTEWPDEMIAQAAYYKGDPQLFVAKLQDKKWLDGRIIHDWIDYAGHYLIKKYSSSNIQRLRLIWKAHGLKYGERDNKSLFTKANRKRTESDQKANLPTLPNLPNLPNQEQTYASTLFGEFERVKLTQEQFDKLTQKLGPETRDRLIAELDRYIESTGTKYKSAYATVLAWSERSSRPTIDKQPEAVPRLTPEELEHGKRVKAVLSKLGVDL